MDNTTSYSYQIGTLLECGGIIHISRGYYTADYAVYEFHIMNDQIAINKIAGTDYITSYSYDKNTHTINFECVQYYLRFRIFIMA